MQSNRDLLSNEQEDQKNIFNQEENGFGPEKDDDGNTVALSKYNTQRAQEDLADTQNLPQVKIHRNKKFENLEAQAMENRERELREMRIKAREEEKLEVQKLLELPQPPVPKGWDYLILPRKINLQRVPLPPTIMLDDYFATVKELKLPLKARGIVFVFALSVITLMLSLIGTLVLRWGENTIWFVIGVDFIFAMAFILLLNQSKAQLELQKQELTKKCQRKKEEDAAALAEEDKDYENNVANEYRYFEFVNTLRLLSRELFTKVNPESNGAQRIESILQELRDKLFLFNEHFSSRFINSEIRSAENFEDWSALRHLATIKELFATHIALLWMTVKYLNGQLKGRNATQQEANIMRGIQRSVQSLLNNKQFVEEIVRITSDEDSGSDKLKSRYNVNELQNILNSFEAHQKPSDDTQKLTKIQELYVKVHNHFAEKAGNTDFAQEFAEDEGDFLFKKEAAHSIGGGALNMSVGHVKQGTLLPEISPSKRESTVRRKDFVQNATGEEHHDNIDFHPDQSRDADDQSESEAFNNADIDRDFAYLRYLLSLNKPNEWRLEHSSNHDRLKIYRRTSGVKGWTNIMMKCIAEIEHIPKHIVMKAITDMNLRAKWDNSMGTLEVLEHDKRQDKTVVKLNMKLPYHMQAREQVYVRKIMKDFPAPHQDMIVRTSCEHARAPINQHKAVRPDVRMSGMLIEDDPILKGTKISWILYQDIYGSLPNQMLNQLHVNYQADFINGLSKACSQIVKGQLK